MKKQILFAISALMMTASLAQAKLNDEPVLNKHDVNLNVRGPDAAEPSLTKSCPFAKADSGDLTKEAKPQQEATNKRSSKTDAIQ